MLVAPPPAHFARSLPPPPMRSPPPPRAAPAPPPLPPGARLPAGALHHLQHFGSMSRTLQYKKITKPLLERKRRARINRCLDELKELMVGAFEAEGENVAKLEKADILELTVRHLHKLHEAGRLAPPPPGALEDPTVDAVAHATRFQAGFSRCAAEAVRFLLSAPGLDAELGRRLVRHLAARCLAPAPAPAPTPPPPTAAVPLTVRVGSPPAPAPSVGASPSTSPSPAGLLMEAPAIATAPGAASNDPHVADASAPGADLADGGPVWRPW